VNRSTVEHMAVYIAGLGALAALATYFVAGSWMGASAAIGAVLAIANWHLYRWIVGRVTRGSVRQQSALMLLLVVKMGALMALVYFLISRHFVEPIGFMIGISALAVGMVAGSVHYLVSGDQSLENER
jgi:hypothetical protein